MALRWLENLEDEIIRRYREQPETFNHEGRQPQDNVPLALAVIRREKQSITTDPFGLFKLRYVAKLHIRGRMQIMNRGVTWD